MKRKIMAPGATRLAIGGLAVVMIVSGLALAVGAGAEGGGSARDAAYPVTFSYKMNIDGHPPKTQAALASAAGGAKATFRFHMTFTNGDPVPPISLKFFKFKCKRDAKPFRACQSPKTYRGLSNGKHTFRVKAQFSNGEDASRPAKFKWTIS